MSYPALRSATRRLPALALTVALLAACGGGGGGGAGGATSGASSVGPRQSAVSTEHWQRALTALGSPYVPASPAIERAATSAFTDLLARAWWGDWFHIRAVLEPQIGRELDDLVQREPLLLGWRDLQIDFDAPPGLEATAPDALTLYFPMPPGHWRLSVVFEVGYVASTQVLGLPVTTTIAGDVTVDARNIRLVAPARFDLSDPRQPRATALGTPQIAMQLRASSTLPLLQQILPQVTAAADPVVRALLTSVAGRLQQLGLGAAPSVSTFGTGGPGLQPVQPPVPLAQAVDQVGSDIARWHLPFGTIAEVWFDQPGYGNGTPVRYGLGDSTIWTGHYLMGEALHWELTGSAQALAGLDRAVAGVTDCLDVAPVDGRLSRCVVPDGPFIGSILGDIDFAWSTLRGQRVGTLNDISRDQYVGVFLGLSQTLLRVPPLRERARRLIARMVGYLDRHDWVARRADGVTPARARYAFSPLQTWAAVRAGQLADPQRFDPLLQRYEGLSSILWLGSWLSASEPLVSYYKFNLGHDAVMICASTETEPARYRDVIEDLEILREATGHHLNAWFDGVYAACVPAAAATWGPQVRGELEAWTLRDRREHAVDLRGDPSIPTVMYTSAGLGQAHPNTIPPQPPPPVEIARYPIPIEKRRFSDFLWQRDPFQLVGGGNGKRQYPGVDLLQPYWLGRSYGLWR